MNAADIPATVAGLVKAYNGGASTSRRITSD